MAHKRYKLLYEWMQKHKREHDWTYNYLAERMGVHPNLVYSYANGRSFPTLPKAAALSATLGKIDGRKTIDILQELVDIAIEEEKNNQKRRYL